MNPRADTGNAVVAMPSNRHEANATAPDERLPDDDRILVDRVRHGDALAYEHLVELYSRRLYHSLLHLVGGDIDLAQEFTQEAFVRAYERLDRFSGSSSFYTWLYRLAHNRAIDCLAKRRPEARDDSLLDAQTGATASPDRDLAREETCRLVQDGLQRLAADQRQILLLRDFEGLDYAAIADLLEVPEGTVKSRINRARRALRELLEPVLSGADL